MFWADRIVEDSIDGLTAKIKSGKRIIVRDEKTASGHPHVGSLIGVAIHDMLARVLREREVNAAFLYEINDMDPMDGMPVYLDEATYKEHMGKPLYAIPAPDNSASNLAEFFAHDFKTVITEAGYTPEFYTLSEVYRSGKMNDTIKRALEHADVIRKIYKEVSKSEKSDDWYPLNVVCESCGKIGTTKVTGFDGEKVSYVCQKNTVEWAEGCGHEGSTSPYDGNATLPWKVEWAAKFAVMKVDVEGAGKDHSTKGGARDVAERIAREVFEYEPPYNFSYEFFLVGGKKMSSSKGNATTARGMADLLPSHILNLGLVGREVNRQKNFDPEGDSVPLLFDQYDTIANKYWNKEEGDEARMFELIHTEKDKTLLGERFLPRFSQIAFLVQMPHISLEEAVADMKGNMLTDEDKAECEMRARYAKKWLEDFAPERYVYKIQESIPESAREFSDSQKTALGKLREYIESHEELNGKELHESLHSIKEEVGIEPKELFVAIYQLFLGRDSGPQAGWFLSTLPREKLISHLEAAS